MAAATAEPALGGLPTISEDLGRPGCQLEPMKIPLSREASHWDESQAEGSLLNFFDDWLRQVGLENRGDDARSWAKDRGAAFLGEVIENLDDFASFLGLSPRAASDLQEKSMAFVDSEGNVSLMSSIGGEAEDTVQPMFTASRTSTISTAKDPASPSSRQKTPMQRYMTADYFERREGNAQTAVPDSPASPEGQPPLTRMCSAGSQPGGLHREATEDFFDRRDKQRQHSGGMPVLQRSGSLTQPGLAREQTEDFFDRRDRQDPDPVADAPAAMATAHPGPLLAGGIPAPMGETSIPYTYDPFTAAMMVDAYYGAHPEWTPEMAMQWAAYQQQIHAAEQKHQATSGSDPDAPAGDAATLQRRLNISNTGFSSYHIGWTVKSDILTSSNAVHVSPSFDLSFDGEIVHFRLILTPRESAFDRGGHSFRRSHGVGKVELKCEDNISVAHAWVKFELTVGRGDKLLPRRGLVSHDFAQGAVGGLRPPADQWWDFKSSVDPESRTLYVGCDVMSQLAKEPEEAAAPDATGATAPVAGGAAARVAEGILPPPLECTADEDGEAGKRRANRCRSAAGRQKQLERWRLRRQRHRAILRGEADNGNQTGVPCPVPEEEEDEGASGKENENENAALAEAGDAPALQRAVSASFEALCAGKAE